MEMDILVMDTCDKASISFSINLPSKIAEMRRKNII
jgi:hypothetical protein